MEDAKNGQQKAEVNLQSFLAWASSKTDDDFKQYEFRGQLSRTEIAKECDFAKSVLVQNPRVKTALAELENELRTRSVLPPIFGSEHETDSGMVSSTKAEDSRVKRLEGENAMLRAEVEKQRKYITRYGLNRV